MMYDDDSCYSHYTFICMCCMDLDPHNGAYLKDVVGDKPPSMSYTTEEASSAYMKICKTLAYDVSTLKISSSECSHSLNVIKDLSSTAPLVSFKMLSNSVTRHVQYLSVINSSCV